MRRGSVVVRKREGRKRSGSGNISGSRKIVLQVRGPNGQPLMFVNEKGLDVLGVAVDGTSFRDEHPLIDVISRYSVRERARSLREPPTC